MKASTLITVVGPTAVGKTGVAVELAKYFKTEILSADSRQIYAELEIGTAKPSSEQLQEIQHHFISSQSIHAVYNAGQFGRDAHELLAVLFKNHESVILCGGSGLYIKAVCEGLDDMPEIPSGVREMIMQQYAEQGIAWLQQQVEERDPDYFAEVDQKNPHRLVRALELNYATGQPIAGLRQQKKNEPLYRLIKIGLELDRNELFDRIDRRMDTMVEAGLFDEAEHLFALRHVNALQTVGYREVFGFLEGLYDREECIRLLKRNSRRYAKRQLTWFKKDPDIRWFQPDQVPEIIAHIEKIG